MRVNNKQPPNSKNQFNRRKFLQAAGLSSGIFALSTLAGCSGQPGDGEEGASPTETATTGSETETEADDTDTPTESEPAAFGEKIPKLRYFNNPQGYNPTRHDAINFIAERLSQLGIDIEVKVLEWGTLYNRVRADHDFDIATWNHSVTVDPAPRLNEFLHMKNIDGFGNFTGYVNEEVSNALETSLQEPDTQDRIDALHKAQAGFVRDCPMNAMVWLPKIIAYHNEHVSGWVDTLKGYNDCLNMTSIEVTNPENELRGTWSETLDTISPLSYQGQGKVLRQLDVIFDKLARINRGGEPDPEVSLAKEWTRPDAETIKYTLRDHQWHDGEDLTAEDVKFTIEYLKKHEISIYKNQWQRVDSVEVPASNEVVVNFNRTVGPVHGIFSTFLFIIPKHIWESVDNPRKRSVEAPVGSGPLKVDYWDKGSELSLVRNSDHWRPPNYKRRIWRIIPEISTQWSLLKDGKLNYLPYTQIGKQLADNQKLSQISVKSHPGKNWWHLSMNLRNKGLNDRAFRQALVHAAPKSVINKQFMYGFASKADNLVTPTFGKFYNSDVKQYKEGIDAAKHRLSEAGYGWGDDDMLHFPQGGIDPENAP